MSKKWKSVLNGNALKIFWSNTSDFKCYRWKVLLWIKDYRKFSCKASINTQKVKKPPWHDFKTTKSSSLFDIGGARARARRRRLYSSLLKHPFDLSSHCNYFSAFTKPSFSDLSSTLTDVMSMVSGELTGTGLFTGGSWEACVHASDTFSTVLRLSLGFRSVSSSSLCFVSQIVEWFVEVLFSSDSLICPTAEF